MDSKRWLKRTGLAVVLSLVGTTVWLIANREWQRAKGERELAEAVAEAEATDPNWRWDALNANRRYPPPGENSAHLVPEVAALLPPNWGQEDNPISPEVDAPPSWDSTFPEQPPNRMYPEDVIAAAEEELGRRQEAVQVSRIFKDFPTGNRRIELTPDVLSTLLPDTTNTRVVALLLHWDTVLAVADGNFALAADNLHALLNVSRSLGDEPFMISQLVRMAVRATAANATEWVLAQTELPEPRLTALQEAWANDTEEPLLLYGVRGDRASFDVLFSNLSDGTVGLNAIGGGPRAPTFSFAAYSWWLYRGRFPGERALFLGWLNQAVEAARLPVREQPAAIGALEGQLQVDEEMKLARVLLPAVDKFAEASWRSLAKARCVAVALACERFRLKHDHWPKQLADLPRELLTSVPTDPYTGEPLRYTLLDDGVVVYSVGENSTDDGGDITRSENARPPDEGIRLWNPDARGLPAPPEE